MSRVQAFSRNGVVFVSFPYEPVGLDSMMRVTGVVGGSLEGQYLTPGQQEFPVGAVLVDSMHSEQDDQIFYSIGIVDHCPEVSSGRGYRWVSVNQPEMDMEFLGAVQRMLDLEVGRQTCAQGLVPTESPKPEGQPAQWLRGQVPPWQPMEAIGPKLEALNGQLAQQMKKLTKRIEAELEAQKQELQWLRFFRRNVADYLGPVDLDIIQSLKEQFAQENGFPEGHDPEQ